MNPFVFLFKILWLSSVSFGAGATEAPCSQAKSFQEALGCVISQSPAVQLERAQVSEQTALIKAARQFQNPDLNIESVGNNRGGRDQEVSVLFPLGFGRRSARIGAAQAATDVALNQLRVSQQETALEVVSALYRIRQIDTEMTFLKEANSTFQQINKTYRQRLKLNPEQEISFSVFELASAEGDLHLNRLITERERLDARLRYVMGGEISASVLPSVQSEWPEVTKRSVESASLSLTNAQLGQAEANFQIARSEAWPDLRVGPKFQYTTGIESETLWGVALSLPIPVFNLNGGQKTAAHYGVLKSQLELTQSKRQSEIDQDLLIGVYTRSTQALRKAQATSRMSERHEALHKLLRQGVVGASLVIELHRQLFEFQAALNEHELTSIQALWKLRALDGTLLAGDLK